MVRKNEVIAAVATPPGVGAISLLRISGEGCLEVAQRFLKRISKEDVATRQVWRDEVLDQEGQAIDDVLAVYYKNPRSYTGEDVVEISGHGGLLVTQRVLERSLECGARLAEPGEFTQRAFFNGKLDLTQAEAVMDLISAQSDLAIRAAREQLGGELGKAVAKLREDLIHLTAHIEAYIDFPEEDISPDTGASLEANFDQLISAVEGLLGTATKGRILREGARLAIVGPPNAGKSSLLNALLGFERAIVSDVAGTTRDTVEEVIDFQGIPVRVIDTAGLREGGGDIEQEGMQRARERMSSADVVIELHDGSQKAEGRLTEGLLVLNKSDLGQHTSWEGSLGIPLSVVKRAGLDELRAAVVEELRACAGEWSGDGLLAINARHQDCLQRAKAGLQEALGFLKAGEEAEFMAVPLREALLAIGEVGGVIDTEEILGSLFSQFCIGK